MKFLLTIAGLAALCLAAEAKVGRDFSVFQVVRFPNGACEGSNNRNGTCFTKQECEDKDGKESGTCADGYGVCCTFVIDECGKESSQNNTYIMNPSNVEAGDCTTRICPAGDNICRLRIDFQNFVLAQPESSTLTGVTLPAPATAVATPTGQCQVDTFRVTCPGGPTPTTLCGTATGQHMYVDAAKGCQDISFFIGMETATRMWNLKVSQIACDDMVNLPPPGCTQWFTEDSGTISTFNYGAGKHLANQNQNFCFRKNRGMCGVCVATVAADDFEVSGMAAAMGALAGDAAGCCGYAMSGSGFDCLQIPAASDGAWAAATTSRFCGNVALDVAAAGMGAGVSICTKQVPLSVRFVSDAGEVTGEDAIPQGGFTLAYELQSTCE